MRFATQYLEQFRFLYRDSDDEDNGVCHSAVDHSCNVSNDSQKWKGRFGGPFILQTFAAHLSAIDGHKQIPDLHDRPSPNAVGALGLAAASVSDLYCARRNFLITHRWSGL